MREKFRMVQKSVEEQMKMARKEEANSLPQCARKGARLCVPGDTGYFSYT